MLNGGQTEPGSLHPLVMDAAGAYLRDVDFALPGVIEELYVTGSGAMGDFRPEISDVDLVAVSPEPLKETQLDTLAGLHRPSHPQVDVLYIARDELRGDPRPLSSPYSLAGTFHREGAFAANPVTWRDLQTKAVTVRGREQTHRDVWFDPEVLRHWNGENLDRYWGGQVERWRDLEPTELRVRHEYGLQWLVLGVPRLHYTINTLQLTSKTGAGSYALEAADDTWHPVIRMAIALRADKTAPPLLPNEEAKRQAIELSEWLIKDAHRVLRD